MFDRPCNGSIDEEGRRQPRRPLLNNVRPWAPKTWFKIAVSFTDSPPNFTGTFLAGLSRGSISSRGEWDGGLYQSREDPHEGTSSLDFYSRDSHARLCTTTRDSVVQRECFRGAVVTRSRLRASAGLLRATGQTGNFSSRQTAHQIQAFCLIIATTG